MPSTLQPWLAEIERDIILPGRDRIMTHPIYAAIEGGEFPRAKLTRMLADILWSIVRFPHYIAALAARAPKHDWPTKMSLLKNVYEERSHPQSLAKAVAALGGDVGPILNGPEFAYQPVREEWERNVWIELVVFWRPWAQAIAVLGVAIEATVPGQMRRVGQALRDRYGIPESELPWFGIHGGEIEEQHGRDGYEILQRHVREDDLALQAHCRDAIQKTVEGRLRTLSAWMQ